MHYYIDNVLVIRVSFRVLGRCLIATKSHIFPPPLFRPCTPQMESQGIQSSGCKVLVCCVSRYLVSFLHLRLHEQSWDVHADLSRLSMSIHIPDNSQWWKRLMHSLLIHQTASILYSPSVVCSQHEQGFVVYPSFFKCPHDLSNIPINSLWQKQTKLVQHYFIGCNVCDIDWCLVLTYCELHTLTAL